VTPSCLTALRIAATLVHCLPALRVRLRHDDDTLFEVVAHPAGGTGPATEGVMGACAFRRAVASAYEHERDGRRIGILGVPAGAAPAIDIGVRRGDAALPGGVYRVAVGDQTVHGFATTLPVRRCREILESLDDIGHVVRLHHDAGTEVTFVHTVTPTAEAPADAGHLASALEALLAEEVVRELAGSPA
jgi:hypothetical protein